MAQSFKFQKGTAWLWPLVVLIITFGAFYFKPWQTKPTETISVSATGKAQVTPNVATITATIESKNPNLEQARKENELKVSMLISALKNLGVEEKDIKTQHISGGPGYEIMIYPPRKPTTNQFTTSLEVKIRNFENTDEIIAAMTQNGATNLYGPNLTVDEALQEEGKSKARENAVNEARKKGEQLAKLSGRKLGKAVKISEQGDYGFPIPIYAQSEADLRQKANQIQPGQNDVTITLQVDFELK
ncbi:SIMPL domain-containing protein [Candidatus Curtissbacteria bacterium]|nr:SIMPL domain-containing protein [Candidatus Curtissbacteria bacterium]